MLPPRGLLHPVLPYRTKDKLMFPLCKTCTDTLNQNPCTHTDQERAILGTWCHVELMKAIEKGYEILNIHEVWHFPTHTDGLFKEYVNTFLKIKQESSGYPKECVTEEQKQAYIDEYYEQEGIRLDPEKIEYNPGLRSLAKLMLNSLWGKLLFHNSLTLVSSVGRAWDCSEKKPVDIPGSPVQYRNEGILHFLIFIGKFAQRSNMPKTDLMYDPKDFFELLYSDEFEVCDARLVNDDAMEVHYRNMKGFEDTNNKVNVVIAAFTTAYARLKLYDLLDLLQERVLYYDTDSVIYVHKPDKPDPPLGNYLGDLTNELDDDDYITSFASGGPKNYTYQTKKGKSDTKIRGITMDYSASQKLTHDVIRELVRLYCDPTEENEKVTIDMPCKIMRDKKEKKIVTKRMKKDYRPVYNKRVVKENYETVPYGY